MSVWDYPDENAIMKRGRAVQMIEIACRIVDVREKSIAVADGTTEDSANPRTGELTQRDKWFWLPTSQISIEGGGDFKKGTDVVLIVPEWLAKKSGLM